MPLKLIAPGKRRGNRFWIARGRVAGKLREFSTNTTDKISAERIALDAAAKIAADTERTSPERMTFRMAAIEYEKFAPPKGATGARIKRLADHFGDKAIRKITHADLVTAADVLYPGKKASTKNRCVIAIAGAVLHYAASNKWCEYLRIPRFKEPKPVTRTVPLPTMRDLIDGTEGMPHLLLVTLFGLGQRITDTLGIRWADLDLDARTVQMRIGKLDGENKKFPLPDDVMLALEQLEERSGFVFPWRSRGGAYKALRKALGGKRGFTPHMARHTLGTLLNASGAGLKTIMATLGHSDAKSSLRYQDADLEIVRQGRISLGKYLMERAEDGRKNKTSEVRYAAAGGKKK